MDADLDRQISTFQDIKLECVKCDGAGEITYDNSSYHGGYDEKVVECPTCKGKGYIYASELE